MCMKGERRKEKEKTNAASSPFSAKSISRVAAPSFFNASMILVKSAGEKERDSEVGSTGEGSERVDDERVEREVEVMRRVEAVREGGRERGEAVGGEGDEGGQ